VKVILNGDAIVHPLTGIGRYALNLAEGLATHADVEEFSLFSTYRFVDEPAKATNANQLISRLRQRVPFKPQALKLYHWLRSQAFRARIGSATDVVFHSPNYILLPHNGPTVTTVHDLSWLRFPECHPKERIEFLNAQLPKSLDQATLVITDSEAIRQELLGQFRISPDRVLSIPLGVDSVFRPRSTGETQSTLAKYRLTPGQYLLCVATREPRKNLERLLDAYEQLTPNLREAYPLALAGAGGWLNEQLDRRVQALSQQGQIRSLGYIPDQDLPLIYSGARGFAFPSLYEGFGLPILEAMASGVPVLTSNSGALAEVSNGCTIQVDPTDSEAINDGLTRLLTDEVWRQSALVEGVRQAAKYSWPNCVDDTVLAYRRAVEINQAMNS